MRSKRGSAALVILFGTLAVCGIIAGGCAGTAVIPFEPGSTRYHFDVRLHPVDGNPGMYEGTAQVTDLEAERTLSIEPFTLEKGRKRSIYAMDSGSGATFVLTIGIDDGLASVKYYAELKKGGRLIASQTSGIPATGPRDVPREERMR